VSLEVPVAPILLISASWLRTIGATATRECNGPSDHCWFGLCAKLLPGCQARSSDANEERENT